MRRLLDGTVPESRVLDLVPETLRAQGVAVLALDFDGVLAPHGADQPLAVVAAWLDMAVAAFGADRVLILSNRPHGPRIDWFGQHLPGVRFVQGVRKKPYCDGLVRVGELTGAPLSTVLMVDDRLLTGCLAAVRAGCQTCYVRAPFVSLRHAPHKELCFMLLRWLERLFVRLATQPGTASRDPAAR